MNPVLLLCLATAWTMDTEPVPWKSPFSKAVAEPPDPASAAIRNLQDGVYFITNTGALLDIRRFGIQSVHLVAIGCNPQTQRYPVIVKMQGFSPQPASPQTPNSAKSRYDLSPVDLQPNPPSPQIPIGKEYVWSRMSSSEPAAFGRHSITLTSQRPPLIWFKLTSTDFDMWAAREVISRTLGIPHTTWTAAWIVASGGKSWHYEFVSSGVPLRAVLGSDRSEQSVRQLSMEEQLRRS